MDSVNLVPDAITVRRRRQIRALGWCGVAVCIVLVLIVHAFSVRRRATRLERQSAPLEEQVATKGELVREVMALEGELQRAVGRQDTVRELLDVPRWTDALADLAEAAEGNTWLETVKLTEVKRSVNSKPTDDDESAKVQTTEIIEIQFSVRGYALSNFDLANFMAALKRSSGFREVGLDYSELAELEGGASAIRFAIEGTLS